MLIDQPVSPSDPDPALTMSAPAPRLSRRRWPKIRRRWLMLIGALFLLVCTIIWLALTAPLSRSLQPITAPSLTLLSAEGRPIARRGAVFEAPVVVQELPAHVVQPFLAIEDRRFYSHLGVDPKGLARAAWHNVQAGAVVEGGSTISQQLAKLAFLSADQTLVRKLQEAVLAVWLETWLDKDEILSRYLSSVYFGDNVYGLRAAASHYFSKAPEALTLEQAALLAGLIKAPSRLAPTSDLEAARERGKVVIAAMVDAGMLSQAAADELPEAELKPGPAKDLPAGSYFADWIFPAAEASAEQRAGEHMVRTTLEDRLQRQAVAAIRSVGVGSAQVALVAMRPDGRVVAMVGGKSYRRSPYNRATQARRQPGSAFKLFVYLAALRAGYTPDDIINDSPVRVGDWTPDNYEGRYRGLISLREAFAVSSNAAAVRLSEAVGRPAVIQAARDLGISGELEQGPTLALGTSGVSLIEMVAAYAAVAANSYPVTPRGLPDQDEDARALPFEGSTRQQLLELLWASANQGSGRAAALPVRTFGKTGTSQDSRDAYFIGFAGDLVTGVWIGRDDNSPVPGIQGGGLPARIWRAFMAEAVRGGEAAPPPVPIERPVEEQVDVTFDPELVRAYDVEQWEGDEMVPTLAPPPPGDIPFVEALPPEDPAVPADEVPPTDDIPTIVAPPPPTPVEEEVAEEEVPDESELE